MLAQYRLITFVLLFSLLLAPFAFAAGKALDGSSEVSSPPVSKLEIQPKQKPNPAAISVTESAVKAGVKSCAYRINQVTDFLTTGIQSGAVLFESPSDPDERLVSISLGLAMGTTQVAYASESFAPNQVNGCGAVYETVVYWEASCTDLAKRQFATFKNKGVMVNSITMLDGGEGAMFFLLPAGTGCVVIKKQVLN